MNFTYDLLYLIYILNDYISKHPKIKQITLFFNITAPRARKPEGEATGCPPRCGHTEVLRRAKAKHSPRLARRRARHACRQADRHA